jgi:bifunctional DNA-binding transcriptional regulator/antitoxin component of YhaV-PrlF toxin-antitoxin module
MQVAKVGKRGAIIVPAELRKRYGIDEGVLVTTERQAEFVLSTATDSKDYQRARKQVRTMGLDPASIRHRRPE